MHFLELLLLALSLCFDTLSISISAGFWRKQVSPFHVFRFVFILSLCQTLMPLIGWIAGSPLSAALGNYSYWIAFALLLFLGLKMIYESLHPQQDSKGTSNPFSLSQSFLYGIATSIDALAVGISLAMVSNQMITASCLFFSTTALSAWAGLYIGKHISSHLGNKSSIIGGILLMGIGTKILLQHIL